MAYFHRLSDMLHLFHLVFNRFIKLMITEDRYCKVLSGKMGFGNDHGRYYVRLENFEN